jgi:hypothetical protein
MPEDEADCVVSRLAESNFDRVKNINGFLSGIIRRVKIDGPDRCVGGWVCWYVGGWVDG